MKKALIVCVALMLTMALANPGMAAEKRISIGTAGTAGALYPMGVAMAETINRHVPGIKGLGRGKLGFVGKHPQPWRWKC